MGAYNFRLMPYEKWMEDGSQDVIQKTSVLYRHVLKQAPESILDPAIDKELVDYIEKCS